MSQKVMTVVLTPAPCAQALAEGTPLSLRTGMRTDYSLLSVILVTSTFPVCGCDGTPATSANDAGTADSPFETADADTQDASTADAPAPTPEPVTFSLAGVHPGASAQPTTTGKQIATLEDWNGKVYAGYGDYGANTGPIAIAPFDPTSRTFTTVHTADTEAIYHYRVIGSKLWAPAYDPRSAADFSADEPWADRRPVGSAHTFDVVQYGADLYLVGGFNDYTAKVYRSTDGGTTWTLSLSQGRAWTRTDDFARFYFAGVYGGKLYVQAVDYYGGR